LWRWKACCQAVSVGEVVPDVFGPIGEDFRLDR
jgi:hypothetical protein